MCGIIGYIGEKEAYPILLSGLERMEYRGYDSAGICTSDGKALHLNKKAGRVENLKHLSSPGKKGTQAFIKRRICCEKLIIHPCTSKNMGEGFNFLLHEPSIRFSQRSGLGF